jgi:YHS domain-containing protein
MTTRSTTLDRAAAVLLTVALFAGIAGPAAAGSATPPVSAVNTDNGVALKGYDPVAYFTTGQPTPGLDQYTYRYKGVTYRFGSAENRDRFKASPDAYAPQYGGYCAYAMSINRIADIDPARWAIVDGKLYLNKNRLAHTLWSVNKGGHISDGDQHWAAFPKVIEAQ